MTDHAHNRNGNGHARAVERVANNSSMVLASRVMILFCVPVVLSI
ncbi:MAG: hypothetical protein ACYC1L_06480 [Alphaproteobacteria bacterium]